jgi:hypothetical protein
MWANLMDKSGTSSAKHRGQLQFKVIWTDADGKKHLDVEDMLAQDNNSTTAVVAPVVVAAIPTTVVVAPAVVVPQQPHAIVSAVVPGTTQAELLSKIVEMPPSTMVGLTSHDNDVLVRLGIASIRALATSQLFNTARAVAVLATMLSADIAPIANLEQKYQFSSSPSSSGSFGEFARRPPSALHGTNASVDALFNELSLHT